MHFSAIKKAVRVRILEEDLGVEMLRKDQIHRVVCKAWEMEYKGSGEKLDWSELKLWVLVDTTCVKGSPFGIKGMDMEPSGIPKGNVQQWLRYKIESEMAGDLGHYNPDVMAMEKWRTLWGRFQKASQPRHGNWSLNKLL